METMNEAMQMLDLMVCPAFCVSDQTVLYVNQAARQYLIEPGCPIHTLLETGTEEYARFQGGCLYLRLKLGTQSCGASVSRMQAWDIFVLEEADQTELQAMALAARELREPLSRIMTVADRLQSLACNEDDSAQDQFARMNKGLFQLLRIVSNMSDAGRYAQNNTSRHQIQNLTAVMGEIFSTASERLSHAQLSVQFSNLDEPVYSLSDPEKLERAIFNLLSNAAKFTPKGGMISAKLTRRGKMLYLTIEDDGCGVAPELRRNIYSRYLRQPGLEDSRFGIGLGMVLVRSAAAEHGGTVLIEYLQDHGTRITLTLEIRQETGNILHAPALRVDYAGERDHALMELSDCLPPSVFKKK